MLYNSMYMKFKTKLICEDGSQNSGYLAVPRKVHKGNFGTMEMF